MEREGCSVSYTEPHVDVETDSPSFKSSLSAPACRIISYQLIVSLHEAVYQREFPAADLSDFVYDESRVDRIYVESNCQQQQSEWRKPPPVDSSRGGGGWGRGKGAGMSGGRWSPAPWRGREVRSEHLEIPAASSAVYKVTLDRRLRPVVLAVHRSQDCPLPLLGDIAADGANTADSGASLRRNQEQVQQLEQALQLSMDFIFREKFTLPLLPPIPPQPPSPPLVILANEGEWRDSRCIHLKIPVGGVHDYLGLVRELVHGRHGNTITTHNNDTSRMMQALHGHYIHMMSPYTSTDLKPLVSNSATQGEAAQLLDGRTKQFFRVQDKSASGSVGAVWYGCVRLPRLVATLPGRSMNGLLLDEALDCMRALWESNLIRRLFQPHQGVKKTAGLCWTLVPCLEGC